MRVLHRDLGFFAIGLVIVYSLSGILLIHRTDSLLKKEKTVEQTLKPNLSGDELGEALKMRNFKPKVMEDKGVILFEAGKYDIATGKASVTKSELVAPFNKFSKLHKMACAANTHVGWLTTAFGVILFFLAVSSLFMFKTSTKQFKKGMLYTGIGIIATVLLLFLID